MIRQDPGSWILWILDHEFYLDLGTYLSDKDHELSVVIADDSFSCNNCAKNFKTSVYIFMFVFIEYVDHGLEFVYLYGIINRSSR